MSTETIVGQSSPSLTRTALVAFRSALGSIAFLSIIDRQYRFSDFLLWAISHWNALLRWVFESLYLYVQDDAQPVIAFTLVILSTMGTDLFLRWREILGGEAGNTTRWRMMVAAALGLVILFITLATPIVQAMDAVNGPTFTEEQVRAIADSFPAEAPVTKDRMRSDVDAFLRWAEEPKAAEQERTGAIVMYALVALTLLFAILASTRMFVWLGAFMFAFVGINALASVVGATVH